MDKVTLKAEIHTDLYNKFYKVTTDKNGKWRNSKQSAEKAFHSAIQAALLHFLDSLEESTLKIQQHRPLYSGTRLHRLCIDHSKVTVSVSNEQRGFWVHVRLENHEVTANSIVECTWHIYIHKGHMALPSQDCSNLKSAQLPKNVKGHFLNPPFRIEAYDTIEGWLHCCFPDKMLSDEILENLTIIFVDNIGRQYPIPIEISSPIGRIEPHTHL